MELLHLSTVLLLPLLPGECRLGATGLGGTGTARRGWGISTCLLRAGTHFPHQSEG